MAVGYAQVILADSPSSYWRLGDLAMYSSAADSKGTVTGTYSGSITRGMPGAVMGDQDACAYFINGKIDMGNHYAFTATSSFTVEAWVLMQALPVAPITSSTVAGYLFNDANGTQGWMLTITTSGQIQFQRYLNSVADTVTTGVGSAPLGEWFHVAATYNGSTMTLYVNGSSVGSTASTKSIVAGTGVSFQLGNDTTNDPFTGMLDEVAVYSIVLTSAQILNHYNSAEFLTNAPTYSAAASGAQAQAGQVNQFLGMHSLTVHNTGTLLVGVSALSAVPGTNWSLASQWLDQPFTLPSTNDTINRIEVALQKLGTGADVTATLQADSGGKPSGTALATVTIPAQFIPTGRSRMVSLPLQVSGGLTPGAVYHLVLQMAGTSGNTLEVPQGGTGLGTLQTSTDGTTWTSHSGVSLIAGIYQGDAPPTRNVRESATAWAELENDAAGHLVGAYEMIQAARTSHRLQYSGFGRLIEIA